MPIYVSLLRGINVGGRNKIRMADLRALYAILGLRQTRTLLQSGNAMFSADGKDPAALGRKIESAIHAEYGFEVRVIMRMAGEFAAILDKHPFSADQLLEPAKLAVVFLSQAPGDAELAELSDSNPGRETIQASGRELFIHYPDGMARSKLNNQRIERKLGVVSTARNWNTCQRILKVVRELGD